MRAISHVLILCLSMALLACATPPETPSSGGPLGDLVVSRGAISLPLIPHDNGLLVIEATYPEGSRGHYVLDTGATRSAIFKRTQKRLGLADEISRTVRVYGMFKSGVRALTIIPSLKLGQKRFENELVAVLDDPDDMAETIQKYDGLIGMDILSRYRVFVDNDAERVTFLPLSMGAISVPPSWRVIQLTANPFLEEDRLLHFMQIRVGDRATQALLDTGSEYSMINWNTARIPQLRRLRKRLRDAWELAGAIGAFEPISRVRVERFRAGQKYWDSHDFIVLDFETLTVLGIQDQPFVIAGADLLAKDSYLMDFENNEIRMAPSEGESRLRDVERLKPDFNLTVKPAG
ncbi:MAG: retropepsin-like aspartic protease [Maricaulaceae bacterium]